MYMQAAVKHENDARNNENDKNSHNPSNDEHGSSKEAERRLGEAGQTSEASGCGFSSGREVTGDRRVRDPSLMKDGEPPITSQETTPLLRDPPGTRDAPML